MKKIFQTKVMHIFTWNRISKQKKYNFLTKKKKKKEQVDLKIVLQTLSC